MAPLLLHAMLSALEEPALAMARWGWKWASAPDHIDRS
jgi:hypothetical protein